jgi:hypothetical protein
MQMSEIHPSIRETFYASPHGAFIGDNRDYDYLNPPYHAAYIASGRRVVNPLQLELPDGYDMDRLDRIADQAGYYYREVVFDPQEAADLAQIGRQLLKLNAIGGIEPPLKFFEEQSLTHLVQLVDQTA